MVFFHSTYDAGTYITHVGIYQGNNRMYHAGDPIGKDYVFSELINPVYNWSGNQVLVSVSVKYLDNRTKVVQISQFILTLEKKKIGLSQSKWI